MCCNMNKGPVIRIAMMGMGMAMLAGMMMGSYMKNRMNSDKNQ